MSRKKPTSEYSKHLSKDERFADLIRRQEAVALPSGNDPFLWLCNSIMSQQLSIKVARIIRQRFLELFEGAEPTPASVAAMPFEELKSIGLSGSKTQYIHNVAAFALENPMSAGHFEKMTDEEIVDYLLPIKGVGRWTIEMLLIFALERPDVFSPDDLGIRQAMQSMYELDPADKKAFRKRMHEIAEPWKPFRSYACLHLWRYKDATDPF